MTCAPRSQLDSPWRVLSVLASPVKADLVVCGISETSLAPKPRLVRWLLLERVAGQLEMLDLLIKVGALEVDDDLRAVENALGEVDGEGGFSVRALESCVVR
jgi:hypothetical protein